MTEIGAALVAWRLRFEMAKYTLSIATTRTKSSKFVPETVTQSSGDVPERMESLRFDAV